jgi:enoyl-CoA hydratase
MSLIRTEKQDRVAVVTLNDPGRRNAISLALAEDIVGALDGLVSAGDTGALVITGEPPAFSAGAVLDDLEQADREKLERIYSGFLAVANFPFPTIAAVNGPAVGAGLNLALACDIRVAGRKARFESRFIDIALHPGGGHTWMMQQLLGPQGAAAVVLCGEPLDGESAVDRGMAWKCVDDEALLDEALRLARHAASTPPELARRLKATMRGMAAVTEHGEAVRLELEQQLWSLGQDECKARIAALKRRISGKR